MENKNLLLEINEIKKQMGLLVESPIPVSLISNLFKKFAKGSIDDTFKKFFPRVKSVADETKIKNILNKIKGGGDNISNTLRNLSKDELSLVLRSLNPTKAAKLMFDEGLLFKTESLDALIKSDIDKILKQGKTIEDVIATYRNNIPTAFGLYKKRLITDSGFLEILEEYVSLYEKRLKSELPTTNKVIDTTFKGITSVRDFGLKVLKLLANRNIKTLANILLESKKGVDKIKNEITEIFENLTIKSETDLKRVQRTLEDKFAVLERIKDDGAEKFLVQLDKEFQKKLKNKEITKADYKQFLKYSKEMTEDKFWTEFIAPNYKQFDKEISGVGSFFKNGIKSFQLFKKDKGFFGVAFNKENFKRLFNFALVGSAQKSADILKRLIQSSAPPQIINNPKAVAQWVKSNNWVLQTYFRAIAPAVLLPIILAMLKTLYYPTSEEILKRFGIGEDLFDGWAKLFYDVWYEDFLDLTNKDDSYKSIVQVEFDDLKPAFNSLFFRMVRAWKRDEDIKSDTQNDVIDSAKNAKESAKNVVNSKQIIKNAEIIHGGDLYDSNRTKEIRNEISDLGYNNESRRVYVIDDIVMYVTEKGENLENYHELFNETSTGKLNYKVNNKKIYLKKDDEIETNNSQTTTNESPEQRWLSEHSNGSFKKLNPNKPTTWLYYTEPNNQGDRYIYKNNQFTQK